MEETFRVKEGLYLVGSLERGLTVYNQQVRAHNLIWALWELSKVKSFSGGKIAVVGGGVTGLTAAACAMSSLTDSGITLFEQRWDLCPLQQGSDNRWLHPRIYDWPELGSRAPGASLPVLNWTEGRASDVARDIIRQFSLYCRQHGKDNRLRLYLGVNHLRISAANNTIEWIGSHTDDLGPFFRAGTSIGTTERFDAIILAPGFGLEVYPAGLPTASYWRNEQHGQPVLNGTRRSYLLSGFGDGALVDLFRLKIERFRQDTILYELFDDLEAFEDKIRVDWGHVKGAKNAFDFFADLAMPPVVEAGKRLGQRLRKDTTVVMHLAGPTGRVTSLPEIFAASSSFLNKFLLFLLYKSGAFATSFAPLEATIKEFEIPRENVICRHGTDIMGHLRRMFIDAELVQRRLELIRGNQAQTGKRLWVPGCFPHYSQ